MERYCIVCGSKIEESMGVVLARDLLDFLSGKRSDMREMCAKDNLAVHISSSDGVIDLRRYLENLPQDYGPIERATG